MLAANDDEDNLLTEMHFKVVGKNSQFTKSVKAPAVQSPRPKYRRLSAPIRASISSDLSTCLSRLKSGPLAQQTELSNQLRLTAAIERDGTDEKLERLIKKWQEAFLLVLVDLKAEVAAMKPPVENGVFQYYYHHNCNSSQEEQNIQEKANRDENSGDEMDELSKLLGIDARSIGFDFEAEAFIDE